MTDGTQNPQQQAPQAWTLPLSYGHHSRTHSDFRAPSVKFSREKSASLSAGKPARPAASSGWQGTVRSIEKVAAEVTTRCGKRSAELAESALLAEAATSSSIFHGRSAHFKLTPTRRSPLVTWHQALLKSQRMGALWKRANCSTGNLNPVERAAALRKNRA